jgi:hypothetical protein
MEVGVLPPMPAMDDQSQSGVKEMRDRGSEAQDSGKVKGCPS